ncbi:hypothetical protein D9M72_644090 [compost metagenome]
MPFENPPSGFATCEVALPSNGSRSVAHRNVSCIDSGSNRRSRSPCASGTPNTRSSTMESMR